MTVKTNKSIAFSGTCYWCMQAMFASLKGVKKATQGWMQTEPTRLKHPNQPSIHQGINHANISDASSDSQDFVEAVVIEYDESQISLDVLIAIHLHTPNPNKTHRLLQRYPSVIYLSEQSDIKRAELMLRPHQQEFAARGETLSTQVKPFTQFEPSPAEQQDYYYQNPQKPFCQVRITPKLSQLMQNYRQYLDDDKAKIISQNTFD